MELKIHQHYKKAYYRNNEMCLKPEDFFENRPLYFIDTTIYLESISNSKSDIIINIYFRMY